MDIVILWVVLWVPMVLALSSSGTFAFLDDPTCFDAAGRLQPGCQIDMSGWVRWELALLAITLGYWWVSNALGASPGKLAVGTRVITSDGRRPGIGRGLARAAVSLVSAWVFALGYLWAFWDSRRQTWHDRAAGTYVVRVRP